MKMNLQSLSQPAEWNALSVTLPSFDVAKMRETTAKAPVWVHFGAGNIFRGFVAMLQQKLLNEGLAQAGIIASDTFDYDIIDKIYKPYDELTMLVGLKPDGSTERSIVASVADSVKADSSDAAETEKLRAIFTSPSLQMVSFTITEKGYALRNMAGETFPVVAEDMKNGPAGARHAMSMVAALMLDRYKAGAYPIALASMDNCSHNGEKLRASIMEIVHAWEENGLVDDGFVRYMVDEHTVAFPWSMIDKITPRPAKVVEDALAADGIEGMAPIVTSKNTFIAPFVNAEIPQYLVVEDNFPNGRPPLEKAGVYMTDRETVNNTERMKVTTCLNPLHTALAVYGCLLGHTSIAAEMQDKELKALVERIGYDEGMPVVTDPGILSPKAFIEEVIGQRFPNPFIPDTPQRIATDTSQKIPIRFGETIKSYLASDTLDVTSLTFIPLAIAGWLRYLLGVDDKGDGMEVSSDPMLETLQRQLAGVELGKPETVGDKLRPILSNEAVFAIDLVQAGLADKIEGMFRELVAGPGAVRATLQKYLG
ncbi:MAG: mannitol dehydrogenase family protein [Eubacteriales bacterium]|nr:mannitol dehydrogenase family protein [Eubacteriales bacterium]